MIASPISMVGQTFGSVRIINILRECFAALFPHFLYLFHRFCNPKVYLRPASLYFEIGGKSGETRLAQRHAPLPPNQKQPRWHQNSKRFKMFKTIITFGGPAVKQKKSPWVLFVKWNNTLRTAWAPPLHSEKKTRVNFLRWSLKILRPGPLSSIQYHRTGTWTYTDLPSFRMIQCCGEYTRS